MLRDRPSGDLGGLVVQGISGRSRPDPVTLAILAGGTVAIFALSALALPVVNATTRCGAVGYE